jgi:hypothetical protein
VAAVRTHSLGKDAAVIGVVTDEHTGMAVNIVLRGPTRSTQRPKIAAESPRKKMARLKIHASDGCDQSSGADLVTPMILVSGNLKTLNA